MPIKRKVRKALDEGGPSLVLRRAFVLAWTRATSPIRATDLRIRSVTAPHATAVREALIVARSRRRGVPVVHAIGDSQSGVLVGVWPFVVHNIAPMTAYNLASPTSSTRSRRRLLGALRQADPHRDIVLLIAGGTDCRLHIYDHHLRSSGERPLEELARDTVVRYGEAIDMMKDRGFRVAVQSVVGAAHTDGHDFAHCGDIVTRGRIARVFNAELERWCRERSVDYVDLFSQVADDRGVLHPWMASDGLHLGRQALNVYGPWLRQAVYSEWAAPDPSPRPSVALRIWGKLTD